MSRKSRSAFGDSDTDEVPEVDESIEPLRRFFLGFGRWGTNELITPRTSSGNRAHRHSGS